MPAALVKAEQALDYMEAPFESGARRSWPAATCCRRAGATRCWSRSCRPTIPTTSSAPRATCRCSAGHPLLDPVREREHGDGAGSAGGGVRSAQHRRRGSRHGEPGCDHVRQHSHRAAAGFAQLRHPGRPAAGEEPARQRQRGGGSVHRGAELVLQLDRSRHRTAADQTRSPDSCRRTSTRPRARAACCSRSCRGRR